ncbi:exosome complex component RRP40 [Phlebotomus argentipes]|uniref:exosome complex component RRP40 n=1 Tax=Phlebotomus argentipes TaxID=94469 RepID=UPI002892A3A5|nr:exosome complex component RRP40 [Phlebotomus argentipes]
MSDTEDQRVFVFPGDEVKEAVEASAKRKVIIGPGLRGKLKENLILATRGGELCAKRSTTFLVNSFQKRYVAAKGDTVIGYVIGKSTDTFRVDIGGSEPASLSYLAFEGATKRNRPDVHVGDILFGRLVVASGDFEPELVCLDSTGLKKDRFGVLPTDGFVFECSINLCRKMLDEKFPLTRALAKEYRFELAVGINGRIWVRGHNLRQTIGLCHAILGVEHIPRTQLEDYCRNITGELAGF